MRRSAPRHRAVNAWRAPSGLASAGRASASAATDTTASVGWMASAWAAMAPSRWVLPTPGAPQITRGLLDAPGASATARAISVAPRFVGPTTYVSKRYRPSAGTGRPVSARMLAASPGGRSHTRSAQPPEHELRDAPQCLEHAVPVQGVGRVGGHVAEVEHVLERRHIENELRRKILLVVLQDDRHRPGIDAVLRQVAVQILEAFHVLVELTPLTVGHEHDAVRALEHEATRGLVVHLPGHRVELHLRREPGDRPEIERQEVEEERPVRLGRQRHHAPLPIARDLTVDVVQVRRLAGPPRPVVDDLARDLTRGVVDERHGGYLRKRSARLRSRSRSNVSARGAGGVAWAGGALAARRPRNSSKYSWTSPIEVASSNTLTTSSGPRGVSALARKS